MLADGSSPSRVDPLTGAPMGASSRCVVGPRGPDGRPLVRQHSMAASCQPGYGGYFPHGTAGPESPRWDMKLLDMKPKQPAIKQLPGLRAQDSSHMTNIMHWEGGPPPCKVPDVRESPAFRGAIGMPSEVTNADFTTKTSFVPRDHSNYYMGPEMAAGMPSREDVVAQRRIDAAQRAGLSPRSPSKRMGRFPGDVPSETSQFLTGQTVGAYELPRPHLYEGAVGATMEHLNFRQTPAFYGGQNTGRRANKPLPPEEYKHRHQSVGMPKDVTQETDRAGARSSVGEAAYGMQGGKRQVAPMDKYEYHVGPVKEDLGYEPPFSKTFPKEMQMNFTQSIRGDCLAKNTPRIPPPPRPPPLPRRPRMLPDGSITPR